MSQRELKLTDPRIRRPLVDLRGALAVLDGADEAHVVALAEAGWLWAFDVGSEGAQRNEWRFLAKSLSPLVGINTYDLLNSDELPKRAPSDWPAVMELLLPKHRKPWLTGREIKRALTIGRAHFIDLVREGELPGTDFRRGPGGSPSVKREDFEFWIRERCIGGI